MMTTEVAFTPIAGVKKSRKVEVGMVDTIQFYLKRALWESDCYRSTT